MQVELPGVLSGSLFHDPEPQVGWVLGMRRWCGHAPSSWRSWSTGLNVGFTEMPKGRQDLGLWGKASEGLSRKAPMVPPQRCVFGGLTAKNPTQVGNSAFAVPRLVR